MVEKSINIEEIKKSKSTEELLEFGIVNIDKPSGPTSFGVDDFLKKSVGLRKASHFGTLDPQVTGVLPIALNRACKLTGFFISHDKTYVGIMEVHDKVTKSEIEKTIKEKFSGLITQLPPVKSRVKRQERQRQIYSFEILEESEKENEKGKVFLFRTKCEGGTYVRKLIHDLGQELKVGAHMLELRRIEAGIFSETDEEYPIVNLYDFQKAYSEFKKGNDKELRKILIPGEIVSKIYPVVLIKKEIIPKLLTGKPIYESDLKSEVSEITKEGKYCIFSEDKKTFIGIYKRVFEGDIILRSDFVMVPRGKDE